MNLPRLPAGGTGSRRLILPAASFAGPLTLQGALHHPCPLAIVHFTPAFAQFGATLRWQRTKALEHLAKMPLLLG